MSQLGKRSVRRVYLVTYSKADPSIFPDRSEFGDAVAEAFSQGTSVIKPLHYATCKENHADGIHHHFHCVIKLSGPKRWIGAKNYLQDNFSIVVNFSDNHDSYYSAYKYISKEDTDVQHSAEHPNLKEAASPKTKQCLSTLSKRRKRAAAASSEEDPPNGSSSKSTKKDKISPYSLSKFVVEHNIRSRKQLFAVAKEQQREGKEDLYAYCVSCPIIDRIIDNTWEIEEAPAVVDNSDTLPRLQVIYNAALQDCPGTCNGTWLRCAKEVLSLNNYAVTEFSSAMRTLLELGRGKHRNILIIGPSDCAKTFLFKPLRELFRVFSNPGHDRYGLMKAADAEIIFLNDFRWSKELIPWNDFLLLLEGDPVHIPTPRNHYRNDVCIDRDSPIVATSVEKIIYKAAYQERSKKEDGMMKTRWKVFKFSHTFSLEDQIEIAPCKRCFADLVLTH